jgi:hypothetical protein
VRFLAIVSRQATDYQEWRREYFSQYDVDELLIELRKDRSCNPLPIAVPKYPPVVPVISTFREFSKRRNSRRNEHEHGLSRAPDALRPGYSLAVRLVGKELGLHR